MIGPVVSGSAKEVVLGQFSGKPVALSRQSLKALDRVFANLNFPTTTASTELDPDPAAQQTLGPAYDAVGQPMAAQRKPLGPYFNHGTGGGASIGWPTAVAGGVLGYVFHAINVSGKIRGLLGLGQAATALTLPQAALLGALAAVVSDVVYQAYESDSLVTIYNDLVTGIANAILSWQGVVTAENQAYQVSQTQLDANGLPLLESIQSPTQDTSATLQALRDAVNAPFQSENSSLLAYVRNDAGSGGSTGTTSPSSSYTGTFSEIDPNGGPSFTSPATANLVTTNGQFSGTVTITDFPSYEEGIGFIDNGTSATATFTGTMDAEGNVSGTYMLAADTAGSQGTQGDFVATVDSSTHRIVINLVDSQGHPVGVTFSLTPS